MKRSFKTKTKIITCFIISFIITLIIYDNRLFIPFEIREITTECCALFKTDESLVLAVMKCESGFNKNAVSLKGACGLMQIKKETFDYIKTFYSLDGDIFDAKTNVKAGCAYLDYLSGSFQGLKEILCAYNAGEGRVREWLDNKEYSDDGLTLKKIPFKETDNYVKSVTTYYYFYGGIINESGCSKSQKNLALLRG